MVSDYSFYYPLYKSLQFMIERMPVYLYKFSYNGQYSYCKSYTGTDIEYGVVHGDDLIYLFDNPVDFPGGLNANDQLASDKLVQTLTEFAKLDKPNLPRCNKKRNCDVYYFYNNRSRMFDIDNLSIFDFVIEPIEFQWV